MLLNDIGKSPDSTFRRINQHLEANYGFKISEDVTDKDLVSIMEQIEEEIVDLKIRGDDSKASPEISKRLLVLEGLRSLRENSMIIQLQSPKLNSVVGYLVDYVVDTFEITGMNPSDFERAVQRAMDEYRSSRYRFPDAIIEQRVRQDAMARIQAEASLNQTSTASSMPVTPDPTVAITPPPGKAPMMEKEDELDKDLSEEQVPMIRNKTGEIVPDPHAAERRKGNAMKEHLNLVKNLRFLLETEVSQAEVMMAAKGFAQELQEMVEKIGRLQNEDLPPVTDKMRETFGTESASAFQTQIYGALQGVMDSLYTAKDQVDNAVTNMASTGQVTAQTDMDLPVDDTSDDIDADLDNIASDLEAEDEFGGAEEEEPLGRAMKTESLQRKVVEMRRLVERARKLREAKK